MFEPSSGSSRLLADKTEFILDESMATFDLVCLSRSLIFDVFLSQSY